MKKIVKKPEGAKLVYQGGHHNVYCDGKTHYKTDGGGYAGIVEESKIRSQFQCDCADWRPLDKRL